MEPELQVDLLDENRSWLWQFDLILSSNTQLIWYY
jgi:hypothetical protein